MNEEIIEGWVKIYETCDNMLAGLIEAKLKDGALEYQLMNRADIGYTMEMGNSVMSRASVGRPLKFFVKPEDAEKALALITEDKSAMMDDPNLDFSENPTDDETTKDK
jgi:hypothetical protein